MLIQESSPRTISAQDLASNRYGVNIDDTVVHRLPGTKTESLLRVASVKFAPNGDLYFFSYPSKFRKDSQGKPAVFMCSEKNLLRVMKRSVDDESLWVPNRND